MGDLPLGCSYLYVLGAGSGVVDTFSLEGPAKAKHIATVDVIGTARAAGLALCEIFLLGSVLESVTLTMSCSGREPPGYGHLRPQLGQAC